MAVRFLMSRGEKDGGKRKVIFFSLLAALLIGAALLGERIAPYDPYEQHLAAVLLPPGPDHLLGTDRFGRDMLSRVIAGAQISIFSALLLVGIIAAAGSVIGIACGYAGGSADSLVMRISDSCLAVPGLVFAMALAAVLNGGIYQAVLALAVVSWPKYARLARSRTIAVKHQEFILAARMAGNSPGQLMARHILPNCAGIIIVTAVLDIGTMMMELAALSFLGLGAKPPAAEWGSMMSAGSSLMQTCPWVVLAPGAGIFLSVAIFNLLGDALRDYWDLT